MFLAEFVADGADSVFHEADDGTFECLVCFPFF